MTTHQLVLEIMPETLAVARLDPGSEVPADLGDGLVSVTRTPDEVSIICAEDRVPEAPCIQGGFKCLRVQGPLGFSMTGVLTSIAVPLADASISILAMSTFDTDYFLIADGQLERAKSVLRDAGHTFVS